MVMIESFHTSDENVGPSSSAFYLGIFYTMAIGCNPTTPPSTP